MSRLLKSATGLFVYTFTILVLLAVVTFWYGAKQFHKQGPSEEPILFTIERGDHLRRIANNLHNKGALENPSVFVLCARILRADSALQAGEYEIQGRASPREILSMFTDGHIYERRLTIPEGLTSFETVRILNAAEELKGETLTAIPTEGSLLPETYNYGSRETREDILERMQSSMLLTLGQLCNLPSSESFQSILDQPCGQAPLKTVRDVISLASIVEKETAVPSERKRVAGVFTNRLNRGIALQTDPTVIYAITKGRHKNEGKGPLGRRLLLKDLEYDSPYNTYKYPGLPPGPIANPGRASIEAVLAPEEHNYIYFVADGTGGHAFAETLAQHNANVAKWRKIRKASGK